MSLAGFLEEEVRFSILAKLLTQLSVQDDFGIRPASYPGPDLDVQGKGSRDDRL